MSRAILRGLGGQIKPENQPALVYLRPPASLVLSVNRTRMAVSTTAFCNRKTHTAVSRHRQAGSLA